MQFDGTISLGNVITLLGMMVSWAAGLYALNRKTKERTEEMISETQRRTSEMHEANGRRLTAVERSLSALEAQMDMVMQHFHIERRRNPRA